MITGVHHVGQVVEDFERALGLYEGVLGATVFETRAVEGENASDNGSETEDDDDPVVRMAFMRVPDCEVHLISREKRGTDIDPLLDSLLVGSPALVSHLSDHPASLSHITGFQCPRFPSFHIVQPV